MQLSVLQLLIRLSLLPLTVALLIGGLRYRALPPNLRAVVWVLGFVWPLNVLGMVLMLQKHNNLFIMPIYSVGELALLAVVYHRTLQSAAARRGLPWLVGGFTLYVLIDSLDLNALRGFRPGQQVLHGLLVLALVVLYFRQLLHELGVYSLRREPMFWVSMGLFFYHVGYLQIALFSNYLLRFSHELNLYIWAGHSLLFMFLYGCYSLALLLRPAPVRAAA